MLEVDGRCYTQSVAVYKLVARHGGLYPSDDPEAAYIVDSVVAHCEDAFPLCYQAHEANPNPDSHPNPNPNPDTNSDPTLSLA